jgi:predicted outer membrane repeat protein
MKVIAVFSVLLVAAVGLSPAAVYVIHPDGSGDFATIQAAIDAAVDGDVIELSDGTYTGDGNRDLDYHGKAITVRSQSGDPETCVIDCEDEEHRGFYLDSGEGYDSVVQGIKVANAHLSAHVPTPRGGGIYCGASSSPTIVDCAFVDNVACWFGHPGLGYGGGMYCLGSPRVENCTFCGNHALDGSGVYCGGSGAPVFTNCAFDSNSTGYGYGGGMGCDANTTIIGCVFSGNSAYSGGGVHCGGSTTITDCTFVGNDATFGGGMSADGSTAVSGCSFVDNSASYGGGIRLSGSVTLMESRFVGNTGEWGAGMSCAGGSPTIVYCLFGGNCAGQAGGALNCSGDCSPTLANCSIVANSAAAGSGVHCEAYNVGDVSVTASRCIIALGEGSQAVQVSTGHGSAVVKLWCSDVFGNAGGDWVGCIEGQDEGPGNICMDPLFCGFDSPDEPYSLHEGSPCLQENSSCGQLIGALGQGCEAVTVVEDMSWGEIKAAWR